MVIAQPSGFAGASQLSGVDLAYLDHQLLVYGAKPSYLRLVNSLGKALDYARGGFHVAVTRGQAGGCLSPATATPAPRGGICPQPLYSKESGEAWADVARAYFDIAQSIMQNKATVSEAKSALERANALADEAYGTEKVAPPRDPGPTAPKPVVNPGPATAPATQILTPIVTAGVSGPSWGGLALAAGLGAVCGVVGIAVKKHVNRRAYA